MHSSPGHRLRGRHLDSQHKHGCLPPRLDQPTSAFAPTFTLETVIARSLVGGIRQRTGTLLAAHALVASFLGSTTLQSRGLSPFCWIALGRCFRASSPRRSGPFPRGTSASRRPAEPRDRGSSNVRRLAVAAVRLPSPASASCSGRSRSRAKGSNGRSSTVGLSADQLGQEREERRVKSEPEIFSKSF